MTTKYDERNPQTTLGAKKYYEPRPRHPCNGCGGEKFEPPKTPQEMEQVLREHIQGE